MATVEMATELLPHAGKRRRGAPPRAWDVPPQPARACQARGCRAAADEATAHPGPASRGGRTARRCRRHVVHVARAGPRHQSVRTGARRARADAAVRHARAHAPVHSRRRRDDDRAPVLELCPTVQPLIDQLEPYPAAVMNDRLDLLAYNQRLASFFPDLESIPIEDRNVLWLAFTDPAWREVIIDWDDAVGRLVGDRAPWPSTSTSRPGRRSSRVSSRLSRVCGHVGAARRRGRSRAARSGRCTRPRRLSLDYTNLWLGQRLGTRIVAFTPADDRTRIRLERFCTKRRLLVWWR